MAQKKHIYILSDVHGNMRRFRSILRQIHLQPEDTLYVLGDVIDRYPDGIRILRQIMAMPNAKMLLGNHEYMMLRALGRPYDDNADDGGALAHWYRNGGKVTHDHFKHLRKALRQQILAYLSTLPLHYDLRLEGQQYKLVHAATREDFDHEPKYKNPVHFAVWKRWDIDAFPARDYTLIFGHTPTRHYRDTAPMEVWFAPGHIDIDCGCGYPETGPDSAYGRLACLRLDDGAVFYSEEPQTSPEPPVQI